ncbi:MAG TPA: hypothetical protein VEI97_15480 [bacterium]|nr:hypothetical protein [bacterium]
MRAAITSGYLCLLIGVIFTLLWPRLLARYSSIREHEGTEHLYAREFWILIGGFYVIGVGLLIAGYAMQARLAAMGIA